MSLLFFLVFLLTNTFSPSYPQESSNQKNIWLVSIVSKLENNIKQASDDLKRYEKEITKCDNTIANSEKIKTTARQKNKPDIEKVASDAIQQANENKIKFNGLRDKAKRRLIQSQVNLDSINKTLKDYSNLSPSVSAVQLNI